jgi:uncharacterized membrane protein
MDDKKNKIDSAIDEVLESERLKQASSGMSKLIVTLANIGILITVIAVVLNVLDRPQDTEAYIMGGALSLVILFVLRVIFKKSS